MYLERKVKYSGRLGALAIVIGRRMATETAVERRKVRYGNTEKCRQKEILTVSITMVRAQFKVAKSRT